MRLLIYGGNEHNIRCQIGKWNLPEKGFLIDQYGIPKDGWSIGFGILDVDGFLFLKTEQAAGTRIYPFSILFDPSKEVWEKFGWNAAHLATSLRSKDNKFWKHLFDAPETFRAENLEAMAQSLKVYQLEAQTGLITELIAGTVFEEESLTVNPLLMGENFPQITALAMQIEALPKFLRCGNGWLLGGSSQNAKGLGVKLVLDNNLQRQNEERVQNVLQNSQRFLGNLQTAGNNAELSKFLKVPVWRWEKDFGESADEVLSRLSYLVELSRRESISDDDLFLIDAADERLLADDIRRVMLDRACRVSKPMSAQRTAFLLEKYELGELSAEKIPAKFFDLSAYEDWLVKNRKLPSESEFRLILPAFNCLEICRRIVSEVENLAEIPAFFEKSVGELRAIGGEGLIPNLAETAAEKTGQNLWEVWAKHRNKSYFTEYLGGFVAEKAREITKKMQEHWMNIYLRFGNDDGGVWLEKNVSLAQAKTFAENLRNHPDSTAATAWFQGLVFSPLRAKLPIEEKRAIANLNNDLAQSWRNFRSLIDLLEDKNPAVKKLQTIEETEFLRGELAEYLRQNPQIELPKIKKSLRDFFGELPDEFADEANFRGEKAQSEIIKLKAAKKNPPPIVFRAEKIAEAEPLIGEICRMIRSEMADEERRETLLDKFFFNAKSQMYAAFPHLPLKIRTYLVEFVYEIKPQKFKKTVEQLFKTGAYNEFSIGLWECLLLSQTGKKIIANLNTGYLKDVGDLRKELEAIVERSIENEKWSFAKKTGEEKQDAIHNPEAEDDSDNGFLERLKFWKK